MKRILLAATILSLCAKGQTMQGFGFTITAGKKTVTVNIPANSLSTVVI